MRQAVGTRTLEKAVFDTVIDFWLVSATVSAA